MEPNVWKPMEAGDAIVGVLLSKSPRNETTGLSAKYQLENENGIFLVWGGAVIDDRMQYVPVGSKVRITYNGKTKNKRNLEVNLFKVEIAENNQDVSESQVIVEEIVPPFKTGT